MPGLEFAIVARKEFLCSRCQKDINGFEDGVPQVMIRDEGKESGPWCRACWGEVLKALNKRGYDIPAPQIGKK